MGPFDYAGNQQTCELTFTQTAGTENERKYKNTFSEEAAIDFKASCKIGVPFEKTRLKMEGKLSFDSSQSWGGSQIGKQDSKKAGGLTLNIPPNEEYNKAYSFWTAVYTSSNGGTFRVAHAVDPLASDMSDWWKIRYGRLPDPALNLPHRFTHWEEGAGEPFKEHWTLSDDFDINYMRGFILREGEKNSISGKYSILSGTIYDGDVIQLCARVYNYSLSVDTGPFDVTFYYVLWDNEGGRIVPDYEWETQSGMTTTINNLNGTTTPNGTSMTEACVFWDTTGLSQFNAPSGSEYGYRFMVRLDEKNNVKEMHEGWRNKDNEDEERPGEGIPFGPDAVQMPGGNNVGTYPSGHVIHVAAKSESQTDLTVLDIPEHTKSLISSLTSDQLILSQSDRDDQDVTFSEESLSIKTAYGMKSAGEICLEKGKKYQLRANIHTETQHLDSFFVKFYDGDPKNGGKLIGMQPTCDIPAGDAYIWTSWAPETTGEHRLWAHVIGDLRYTDRKDTWETLDVTVTNMGNPRCYRHR